MGRIEPSISRVGQDDRCTFRLFAICTSVSRRPHSMKCSSCGRSISPSVGAVNGDIANNVWSATRHLKRNTNAAILPARPCRNQRHRCHEQATETTENHSLRFLRYLLFNQLPPLSRVGITSPNTCRSNPVPPCPREKSRAEQRAKRASPGAQRSALGLACVATPSRGRTATSQPRSGASA